MRENGSRLRYGVPFMMSMVMLVPVLMSMPVPMAMRVCMRRRRPTRTRGGELRMHLLTRPTPDELYRMLHDACLQQRLQVRAHVRRGRHVRRHLRRHPRRSRSGGGGGLE